MKIAAGPVCIASRIHGACTTQEWWGLKLQRWSDGRTRKRKRKRGIVEKNAGLICLVAALLPLECKQFRRKDRREGVHVGETPGRDSGEVVVVSSSARTQGRATLQ
jgi:hypothetical protein